MNFKDKTNVTLKNDDKNILKGKYSKDQNNINSDCAKLYTNHKYD